MASDNLKQRIKDDREPNISAVNNNFEHKHGKRTDMAKRGLRSLSIAVVVPLSLSLLNIYLFGSSHTHINPARKISLWFSPLWLIHTACMASSLLMGLSAWLFWAEGGFHRDITALYLYLTQLGSSLVWYPIVFSFGPTWLGLAVCLAMVGALAGFLRVARQVNPIAGDLVKPCLAWAAFLSIVNLNLFLAEV